MKPLTSFLTLLLTLLAGAYGILGGEVLERLLLGKRIGAEHLWKQELIPLAVTSITYELSAQRWTVFDLPPKTVHLRLVSNANAHSSPLLLAAKLADSSQAPIWSYALEWEALDVTGQVLRRSVHHLRTGLSLFQVGGGEHPGAFYMDQEVEPLDSAVTQLDVVDLSKLQRLRLRLAAKDADLTDVVVRLYTPEEESEQRLGLVWQRMNDRQKELLSRGSIFSHDLLSEEEKRNLLRRPWKPLAPAGWEGTDYRSRTIYVVQDDAIQRTEPPALPAGVISGPGQIGVIPVPEGGGAIRLTWTPLPEVQTAALPKPTLPTGVTLRWIGINPSQRSSQELSWEAGSWQGMVQGGFLEIESNHAASFRAFLEGEKKGEITPQPAGVRSYRLLPERPVEYTINHVAGKPTPFRLDVRLVSGWNMTGEQLQPPAVAYQLLDKDGQVVGQGRQNPVVPWSLYDRLPDQRRVSDPMTLHFLMPSNVVSVKVFSEGVSEVELLVAGSTRPAELPWVRRIPEERFAFDNKDMNRHRAWFPVRPEKFDQMIQHQESLLVTLQSRPPEEDLELTAGRYLWTELRPDGAWLGRRLLTPRAVDQTIRFETLPILFQPVVPNKTMQYRFDDGVAGSILVWNRQVATPFPLRLGVDGAPFFATTLAGTTGFTEVPTIARGEHRIILQAPETGRYYLNGASPSALATDEELYLLRLANRIGEQGLTFSLERTATIPETLWGRFYRLGDGPRSLLSVGIEGLPKSSTAPFQEWSFDRLHLDLRSDNPGSTLVLGSEGERVDGGQPFFIHFGDGAPPGRYRIHVQTQTGVSGYLVLAQVTPGAVEQRRLFMEEKRDRTFKQTE